MKIRSGFVSNSSSSSFIISSKEENPKIVVEIPVKDLSHTKITSIEELKDYFLDNYGLQYSINRGSSFEEALKEDGRGDVYNKAVEMLNNGEIVYCCTVCNDGEDVEAALYGRYLPKSENYNIISDNE